VLNEDPVNAHEVRLDLSGFHTRRGLTVSSYGRGDAAVTTRHENGDGAGTRTLPPYSITALVLNPAR
jgi:hypothetical protein